MPTKVLPIPIKKKFLISVPFTPRVRITSGFPFLLYSVVWPSSVELLSLSLEERNVLSLKLPEHPPESRSTHYPLVNGIVLKVLQPKVSVQYQVRKRSFDHGGQQ